MVMMMIKESKCVSRSFLRGRRRIERIYLRKHEVFLRQQNEAGTCYSYLPLRGGNMTPFGKKKVICLTHGKTTTVEQEKQSQRLPYLVRFHLPTKTGATTKQTSRPKGSNAIAAFGRDKRQDRG